MDRQEYQKMYYAKNREKLIAYQMAYYRKHREKYLALQKIYDADRRKNHRDEYNAYQRKKYAKRCVIRDLLALYAETPDEVVAALLEMRREERESVEG